MIIVNQWDQQGSDYFTGYENRVAIWNMSGESDHAVFVTEVGSDDYKVEFLSDRIRLTQLKEFFAPAGQVIDLIGFSAIRYRDFYQEIVQDGNYLYAVSDTKTLDYGAFFDGWGVGQFDSDTSIEIAFAGANWPYASIAYPLEVLNVDEGRLEFEPRPSSTPLNFAFSSVVHDFNSDGFDDIFVATTGDDFEPFPGDFDRVFFGSRSGLNDMNVDFVSQTKTFSHWVTSGNIDGDSNLDIIVGSVGGPGNTAPYILSYVNGSFRTSQAGLPAPLINDFIQENGTWIIKGGNRVGIDHEFYLSGHLADLNLDGFDDLIVGVDDAIMPIDYRPAIFLNKGDGSFNDIPLYLGNDGARHRGILGLASGDYDGDGYPEIWVSETKVDRVGLEGLLLFDDINSGFKLLGSAKNGDFGFDFNANAEFPYELLNVDVNNDGHLDVVSSFNGAQPQNAIYGNYVNVSPIILINDGTGRFQHLDMGIFEKFGLQMIPLVSNDEGQAVKFVTLSFEIQSEVSAYLDNPQTTFVLLESEAGIGTAPNHSHGFSLGVPGFNEQYYSNQYGYDLEFYKSTGKDIGHVPYAPGTLVRGGPGVDWVHYKALPANSLIFDEGPKVNRAGMRDSLIDIERIEFSDKFLALDTDGATSAGGIYRLYKATFNREPDGGGLGYWIAQADSGSKDAVRMAEDFTWSQEFQSLYNISTSDNFATGNDIRDLITGFYENVLGRTPDQGGLDFYTSVIQTKEKTVGRVLAEISDSQENYDGTIELIASGITFEPWLG